MELTDVYRRAPGCCSVCTTPNTANGVIELHPVDTGMVHRTFALYLCGECALQAGQMIAPRFGKALASSEVIGELAVAHNTIAALEAQVAEADRIFAAIRGDMHA